MLSTKNKRVLRTHFRKDRGAGDSSYSSSDSDESVLDHVVDTSGWPTDWHDTWECAIGLANSSGNSSTKLRVAQRLMKTIFAAKQQWDAST